MTAILACLDDPRVEVQGESISTLERFENFFNIPWAGHDWVSMEPEAICDFFMVALHEFVQKHQENRDAAIAKFNSLNFLTRAWLRINGWEAPKVVTFQDMVAATHERCKRLSSWAVRIQYSTFYAEFDMRPFITKSLQVAELLCPPQLTVV